MAAAERGRDAGLQVLGADRAAAPTRWPTRRTRRSPSTRPFTATVQELHLVALHVICAALDRGARRDPAAVDAASCRERCDEPARSSSSATPCSTSTSTARAGRLAPDAPVPVLDDLVEHPRPGGAALAAVMAARDGHEVVLVTALGDDDAGDRVRGRCSTGVTRARGCRTTGRTPVKQRVRAGGQSLLRLDSGSRPRHARRRCRTRSRRRCRGAAAVLVADYGRGVTAVPALRDALSRAAAAGAGGLGPAPARRRRRCPAPGWSPRTRAEAALFADRLERSAPGTGRTLARRGRPARRRHSSRRWRVAGGRGDAGRARRAAVLRRRRARRSCPAPAGALRSTRAAPATGSR